jgi:phosphoesterase RecJ-like protein
VSLRKCVECIKRNKRFLLTVHTNPEGDALGAQLAFHSLLKKLGKSAVIINEDRVPDGYQFLPGVKHIEQNTGNKRNLKRINFDCLAVLDCSDLQRTGEVYKINTKNKHILNIDHHISNNKFGDVNWIEPYSSSASEMVYKLYKKMGVLFDKDSATCLYVGILTDTGSFRYSNTSSFTHKAVSQLLRFGLNIPQIYKNIYENIPFEDMKLLGKVLPNMRREAKGKVVWFQVEKETLTNKKLSFDFTEHILSFGRAIKDVQVVVLFKENLGLKDEIRVNFRSQGKVDVNKIAQLFGGGGHKTASGATVKGKINQVRIRVLAEIKEALK